MFKGLFWDRRLSGECGGGLFLGEFRELLSLPPPRLEPPGLMGVKLDIEMMKGGTRGVVKIKDMRCRKELGRSRRESLRGRKVIASQPRKLMLRLKTIKHFRSPFTSKKDQ